MIIALDGPAGSGKSTIARFLSKHLAIEYIDSGAIYRTLTLHGIRQNKGNCEGHGKKVADYFSEFPQHLKAVYEDHSQTMYLHGKNVSAEIRNPIVTKQVKHIANNAECRNLTNSIMRNLSSKYDFVIDGRDIGTIVFPDTPFKFYLDAKPEIRATRRAKELNIPQSGEKFQELLNDIQKRDAEDMAREIGPLRKAQGAIVVDTSMMDIDQVVGYILKQFESLKLAHSA